MLASLITRNRQRCILPPLGAQTPASRISRISSLGTGSDFSRRIDRVVRMISNKSGVLDGSWGIRRAVIPCSPLVEMEIDPIIRGVLHSKYRTPRQTHTHL